MKIFRIRYREICRQDNIICERKISYKTYFNDIKIYEINLEVATKHLIYKVLSETDGI